MKSSKFRAKRVQEEEDEEILPQAKIGVDLIKKPTIFFVQNILASFFFDAVSRLGDYLRQCR